MKKHKPGILLVVLAMMASILLSACDSNGQPTPTVAPTQARLQSTPTIAATQTRPTAEASTPAATEGVSASTIEAARKALQQMALGQYADVVANFDKTMHEKLPADQVKAVWEQVVGQFGAFQGEKGVTTSQQQGFDIVVLTAMDRIRSTCPA